MTYARSRYNYIAWDGEGVTNVDGRHAYIMLVTSQGRKRCPCGCGQTGDWLINPLGISTLECLDFYWSHARNADRDLHVIYGGSYDFNCWLRDIDRDKAAWLWRDGTAPRIGKYRISYNKSSLSIARGTKSLKLWDVVRFWQASFVKALAMSTPQFDALAQIQEWKQKRSDFHSENLDDVLHYCLTELRALVALMEQFDADLAEAGIGRLRQLNGAGSVAAKLLTNNRVRNHIEPVPGPVQTASEYAYAGGRIELWQYGRHIGPFYTYDIVSAYPYAMTFLPSLRGGEWERTKDVADETDFSLYRVEFEAERAHRGYPFFQRLENGNILYPRAVNGWYCAPEVNAALRTGFDLRVVDGWRLHVDGGSEKPFSFVPIIFNERARLKAHGRNGAQLQLKLGLNSLYGKLAQTVGGTATNPPPFHCFVWAAHVTGRTRASVFTATQQNPDAIAYISTDGIGTVAKLDLPVGKHLGEWEFTEWEEAILIQAGVYFLRCVPGCDCTPDKRGHQWHPKYRGFDAGSIDPDTVLRAWRKRIDVLEIPATRFITLGSALAGRRFKQWCSWRTVPRDLHLRGGDGKRFDPHQSSSRPWRVLCDMEPVSYEGIIDSHKYKPKWNEELRLETIDGVSGDIFDAEMVAYDNAHRLHHEGRASVLHDYIARSK